MSQGSFPLDQSPRQAAVQALRGRIGGLPSTQGLLASPTVRFLLLPWLSVLLVKLLLTQLIPLSHDEAYYWAWSHRLAWSYYDHPPFVAWLLALGHGFEGWGHAVRWPAVILGHCTLLIWFEIMRAELNVRRMRWWFWLCVTSPLTGLGSLLVLPDLPLMFWWSLSLLVFQRCLEKLTWRRCLLLGCCLGLGFSSKYHMVLFVPSAMIAAWRTGHGRILRNIPALATVAAGGLIGAFPVWWWNLNHDFVSFRYQLEHGLQNGPWRIAWTLEYLGGQFLLVFPPIVLLALRKKRNPLARCLQPFVAVPLLFFLLTSFRSRVEANWPMVAYPCLFALAVMEAGQSRWLRLTVRCWTVGTVLVLTTIAVPWLPLPREKLKTSELFEYDALARAVRNEPELYVTTYQMASQVTYRVGRPISKLRGYGRLDFYDFLDESHPRSEEFGLVLEKVETVPELPSLTGYEAMSRRQLTDRFDLVRFRRVSSSLVEGG